MKRMGRIVFKSLIWAIGIISAISAIAFITLWHLSPNEPQPILDANGNQVEGSISSIEKLTLGGVEQYLIIRGHDASAPVMLFLHGGPGSSEYSWIRQKNPDLEKHFVMVYWEQRGAGMSYDPDNLPEEMNVARFIADTDELSLWLRERFEKEKIFLMGHSWGSFLGLRVIEQHPEHFSHYFGLGQVGNQQRGEEIGLEWARAKARDTGNKEAIAALSEISVPAPNAEMDDWWAYIGPQRKWLDVLGGGMSHEPTSYAALARWVLTTPEYSMSTKMNYLRGSMFSLERLWSEISSTNLLQTLGPVDVPVTILHGAWDYVTPLPVAQELFDVLDAPDKHFELFEHSAHGPIFEEPEKFNAMVLERAGMKQ